MSARIFHPMKRGYMVTSSFGMRNGSLHAGTDFGWVGGSGNLPIYAVKGGTVMYTGAASGYGGPDPAGWIVIDHPAADGGGVSEYGHIIREVKVGQRVEAGQRIGYINPSSRTNGGVAPHLHLAVMPYAYDPRKKLDPLTWLDGAQYPGEAPLAPAPVPTPAPVNPAAVLSEAMGGALSMERYAQLAPSFGEAMRQAGCTTVVRAAMWCSQIGHESGGLRWMEEIADGSAYEGRKDLGNTKPGDGKRFKGRGPIQVTGRENYANLSKWAHDKGYVPSATFFVDNPAKLSDNQYGFLGPVWYWTVARDMNSYADRRDIIGGSKAVNGGTNGLPDRTVRWNNCLAMGERLLSLLGTPSTEGSDEMTPEQEHMLRHVYNELTQRYPSRSALRETDEPVDTLAGFLLNIDGRIHEKSVEDDRIAQQLNAVLVALEAVIFALKGGK